MILSTRAQVPYFTQWLAEKYPSVQAWTMSNEDLEPYWSEWENTAVGYWYKVTPYAQTGGAGWPAPPADLVAPGDTAPFPNYPGAIDEWNIEHENDHPPLTPWPNGQPTVTPPYAEAQPVEPSANADLIPLAGLGLLAAGLGAWKLNKSRKKKRKR